MREPRNLQHYSTAEDAARGLEQIANGLRSGALENPLVKWHINVSFWNPEWKDTPKLSQRGKQAPGAVSAEVSAVDPSAEVPGKS